MERAIVPAIVTGSSPLARGLLRIRERVQVRRRIIPARAGFTPQIETMGLPHRDHPRSRGVYSVSQRRVIALIGSSPLARGLLPDEGPRYGDPGIIPARAGFTADAATTPPSQTDHPRSRGVYRASPCGVGRIIGSSPLARGLRRPISRRSLARRIIPARAGFTTVTNSADLGTTDHPRSRGVYYSEIGLETLNQGSSPLARGLRRIRISARISTRIIPARAGFTGEATIRGLRRPDHPRSRGVYSLVRGRAGAGAGSSPLARGLPVAVDDVAAQLGIIPARAGFTFR